MRENGVGSKSRIWMILILTLIMQLFSVPSIYPQEVVGTKINLQGITAEVTSVCLSSTKEHISDCGKDENSVLRGNDDCFIYMEFMLEKNYEATTDQILKVKLPEQLVVANVFE